MSGRSVDAVIGTRIGGTAAAIAAQTCRVPALGLVAPVFDASAYFREIFRSHMMSELKSGLPRGSVSLERKLQQGGCVDVLGYPLGSGLYRSINAKGLESLLGRQVRSLLVVQIGGGKSGRALDDAAERLRGEGVKVKVAASGADLPWWFGGGSFRRRADEAINAATTTLVREWVVKGSAHDR
jgi:hypothetical protein